MLLLVYDCTNEASFKSLQSWLELARSSQDGKLLPGTCTIFHVPCASLLMRFICSVLLLAAVVRFVGAGIVVANKSDVTDRVAVPAAKGADFAAANSLEFFECSALQGTDADAPFYYLANKFYRMYEEKVQLMTGRS